MSWSSVVPTCGHRGGDADEGVSGIKPAKKQKAQTKKVEIKMKEVKIDRIKLLRLLSMGQIDNDIEERGPRGRERRAAIVQSVLQQYQQQQEQLQLQQQQEAERYGVEVQQSLTISGAAATTAKEPDQWELARRALDQMENTYKDRPAELQWLQQKRREVDLESRLTEHEATTMSHNRGSLDLRRAHPHTVALFRKLMIDELAGVSGDSGGGDHDERLAESEHIVNHMLSQMMHPQDSGDIQLIREFMEHVAARRPLQVLQSLVSDTGESKKR